MNKTYSNNFWRLNYECKVSETRMIEQIWAVFAMQFEACFGEPECYPRWRSGASEVIAVDLVCLLVCLRTKVKPNWNSGWHWDSIRKWLQWVSMVKGESHRGVRCAHWIPVYDSRSVQKVDKYIVVLAMLVQCMCTSPDTATSLTKWDHGDSVDFAWVMSWSFDAHAADATDDDDDGGRFDYMPHKLTAKRSVKMSRL